MNCERKIKIKERGREGFASVLPRLSMFHDCVNHDKTCSEEKGYLYSLSFRAPNTLVLECSRGSRLQMSGVLIHRRQVTIRTGARYTIR